MKSENFKDENLNTIMVCLNEEEGRLKNINDFPDGRLTMLIKEDYKAGQNREKYKKDLHKRLNQVSKSIKKKNDNGLLHKKQVVENTFSNPEATPILKGALEKYIGINFGDARNCFFQRKYCP